MKRNIIFSTSVSLTDGQVNKVCGALRHGCLPCRVLRGVSGKYNTVFLTKSVLLLDLIDELWIMASNGATQGEINACVEGVV